MAEARDIGGISVPFAAGVAAGGRTGLTAFTTGVMFVASLLLAVLFLRVDPGFLKLLIDLTVLFIMEELIDAFRCRFPDIRDLNQLIHAGAGHLIDIIVFRKDRACRRPAYIAYSQRCKQSLRLIIL